MSRLRSVGAVVFAIAAMFVVSPAAWAAEEETAGNNLSYPVMFPEGIGLTGSDIAIDSGLRAPPETGATFTGAYWYGWLDGATQVVCDPATAGCPPAGVSPDRFYFQQDEGNAWQAGTAAGEPGVPVMVTTIDWGDNLESASWYTNSIVRVETVLHLTLATPLTTYEMWPLFGKGPGEMHGARVTDAEPPVAITTEGMDATVFSPCARLTIQKLTADAGDPGAPPAGPFTWNPTTGAWDGAAQTLLASAVWERFGIDGPIDAYGAEVNVGGTLIYGYNWKLRDTGLPAAVNKIGWYRITQSLDATGRCGGTAAPIALNTSFAAATILPPAEEEELAFAPAVETPGGFTAVVDPVNDLSYLDVYIGSRRATCGDGAVDAGEECDDGNLVDGDCCSQDCQLDAPGTPCTDDGNVCTDDVCDAQGECAHPANQGTCDDGLFCTVGDVCAATVCAGTARDCSAAAAACHAGVCNEETDACEPAMLPDDTPCEDGDACSLEERCVAGTCVPGAPRSCAPCEQCDTQRGCVVEPLDGCFGSMAPARTRLRLVHRARKHQVAWRFARGDATTMPDVVVTPGGSSGYELCVYDAEQGVAFHSALPSAGFETTRHGVRCRERLASGERLSLAVRAGERGRTRIRFRLINRSDMDMPDLPLAFPVVVQLRNMQTGACWSSTHDRVRRQDRKGRAFMIAGGGR